MPRAWTLTARPQGAPTADNFALVDLDLPPLGEGQIRVRNRWLSVDPYMRGRMNDMKSYVPPFQIGAPMEGGAIGEVVESNAEANTVPMGARRPWVQGWPSNASPRRAISQSRSTRTGGESARSGRRIR